jgi:hypothetical protein
VRRRVSGPSKAAVQDALKDLRKDIDAGITEPAPSNYTVRRCCEDWLAHGLAGRDPKDGREEQVRTGACPSDDRLDPAARGSM